MCIRAVEKEELLQYKFVHLNLNAIALAWVVKRLTGHDKLQNILYFKYILTYGSLPTHEIAILLFFFKEVKDTA